MDKIKRIEKYLFEFFSSRFENIDHFYRSTHEQREWGIYKLKDGNLLMDFIISIHGNIEEQFYFERLIPQKFASPESLLLALDGFKRYLNENQKYLDKNSKGDNVSYLVTTTQHIKTELVQMIDYTKTIYDYEDTVIPYQELRYKLITHNILTLLQF